MNRRDSILAAIQARFLTITVPTYHTNFGTAVYLWRSKQLMDDNLPAGVIRDLRDDFLEPRPHDSDHHRMTVQIEVMNKPGTDGATFARHAMADVIKSIGTDYTWGGLAITTEILNTEMQVEEAEKVVTGGIVTIAVDFRTVAWQEE